MIFPALMVGLAAMGSPLLICFLVGKISLRFNFLWCRTEKVGSAFLIGAAVIIYGAGAVAAVAMVATIAVGLGNAILGAL